MTKDMMKKMMIAMLLAIVVAAAQGQIMDPVHFTSQLKMLKGQRPPVPDVVFKGRLVKLHALLFCIARPVPPAEHAQHLPQ